MWRSARVPRITPILPKACFIDALIAWKPAATFSGGRTCRSPNPSGELSVTGSSRSLIWSARRRIRKSIRFVRIVGPGRALKIFLYQNGKLRIVAYLLPRFDTNTIGGCPIECIRLRDHDENLIVVELGCNNVNTVGYSNGVFQCLIRIDTKPDLVADHARVR